MLILSITTIILFVIYTFGVGYTVTRFAWKGECGLESMIMRMAAGLGTIPPLMILLNRLGVSIDWRILLVLSLLVPLWDFLTKIKKREAPRRMTGHLSIATAVVLALFLISVIVYCGGAFTYPWLEDDDSWDHAAAVKFIAVEKTIQIPSGEFQYVNPYPPGYDLILALLHQTHPSVYWVLKFFNGLFVALSILFFYYFARRLMRDDAKAALATFFLSAVPCYMSHFIWAHSLVVTLFFPAFYFFLKIREDKRFFFPAVLVVSGIFLTHPLQAIKFLIMFIFLAMAASLTEKKSWAIFAGIIILAGIVSLTWWVPVIRDILSGTLKMTMRSGIADLGGVGQSGSFLARVFSPGAGTATRAYTWQDYFFAPEFNLINNPIGVGSTLCILTIIGIVFAIMKSANETREERAYGLILLSWLTFTFLGMNSKTFHLPIGLVAFRFWMLFAIPVALLSAEAFFWILNGLQRPLTRKTMAVVMTASILATSAYFKVHVNMGPWPWGVYWISAKELKGYLWLRENLPPGTKVFAFMKNYFVIGHDMHADFWSPSYKKTFTGAIGLPVDQLHAALKKNGFDYVIVGEREIKEYGAERVQTVLDRMNASPSFKYVSGAKNSVWIFRVK